MLDRTVAPLAQSIADIRIPFPEIGTLGNDFPALLVPEKNFPVISFELILSSGKWYEQHPGTSYYAAKMIAEGGAGLSAEEISSKFESTGSFLQIVPSTDWVLFKLHTLKKFFEPSLRLLFDLIQEASFPPDRFERLALLRQQNIRIQLSKNSQYANLKIGHQLYGEKHPYGRQLTPELATEVPLEHVKSYYNNYLFHEPKITLVGDFEEYLPLIDELTNQIPASIVQEEKHASEPGKKTYRTEHEGSTQASIRLGGLSIDKTHEDIHGYSLVHMVLGGYFGSRLMKNLREDKGLTYGVHAQLAHQKNASHWIIGSEVKKDHIESAIGEINKEIDKMRETLPLEEELEVVKNYARGKLLSSFDSSSSISAIHKAQFMADIPLTYLSDYLKVLNDISPENIRDLAVKHLALTHEVIIA